MPDNYVPTHTASVTVGGITSGDSWPAGTSIETILRALLDPQQP